MVPVRRKSDGRPAGELDTLLHCSETVIHGTAMWRVHARKLYSTAVCPLHFRHTPTAAGAAVEYNFNGGRTHRAAAAVMGDGGDVTRCRPRPGPSRQRLRHRAEALEGGFRSNIARC